MTRDVHQQAREWIVLTGAGGLSDAQQSQLQAHLRECDLCQKYAEDSSQVIRSLRSVPMAATPLLVRRTQARVRQHAQLLRQQRERLWMVGVTCAGVGFSAAVTIPIMWKIFSWMGTWAGVSSPVWQTGFTVFLIAPALLVSVLLLLRGVRLTDDAGRWHH
jgi:ferric-dicitrate binding protein FerR (iron transport regulator)